MRLTNYIRDAFIESAIKDVPRRADHDEQIRKIIHDDVLSREPKEVQTLWNNPELRGYLETTSISVGSVSAMVPRKEWRYSPKISEGVMAQAKKLTDEMRAEEQMLRDLRAKLKGAAYACTTTKQLRELLPEFSGYLPAEEEATCRTLPAVANLVADFTKAGWPKEQKQQTKVAA